MISSYIPVAPFSRSFVTKKDSSLKIILIVHIQSGSYLQAHCGLLLETTGKKEENNEMRSSIYSSLVLNTEEIAFT